MKDTYLLRSKSALDIYKKVQDMPIFDYHCHLVPKEIFEDKQFLGIGQMWLEADHYKWRLMRNAGVPEEYITGSKSYEEKFLAYIKAVSTAVGNPLYHWSQMELSMYFDIDLPLTEENASEIYKRANEYIEKNKLSPRKLIEKANVSYIATTDDPADSLEYHVKMRDDKTLNVTVAPCFRTDNVVQITKDGYTDYIKKLSDTAKVEITDLATLKTALTKRLDAFIELGCKFSDVGAPFFPNAVAEENVANEIYKKALKGEKITDDELYAFVGNMYVFLGKLYNEKNIAMQLHLAVFRNSNSEIFKTVGGDSGCDCINDAIPSKDIILILDSINSKGGLPNTIIYTLNPEMTAKLCSIAGSFRRVRIGAAWWFCDNKRGIENTMQEIVGVGHLGTFLGMLTDSRSFLSYARHDYFRRILCSMLAEFVDSGEFSGDIVSIAKNICSNNIKNLIEGK